MLNIKTSTYEAELGREYEALTDKHKTIMSLLEESLSSYMKKSHGPPVTVQGPYGSGKTQLLYHLFKYTFNLGGVGIYTHLEKIIPEQSMGPSEYAEYLKKIVQNEIGLLKKGKSMLMSNKARDYAVSHINQTTDNFDRIVLFVDEIEQQYKLLNQKVATDDRSPMREVVGRVNNGEAGFYLVLAFAPVSFYEFSKGEAQTGRYLPIILPMVEPRTLRKTFGDIGNLLWWMGKGRYRGTVRTNDILQTNISNISKITKKELLDICNNIGSIGEVPALEFENIERVSLFEDFKDFLVHLEPKMEGGEIYSGTTKITKKCKLFDGKKNSITSLLENSMRNLNVAKTTIIAYYLSIIIDGLSSEEKIPIFTDPDDWKELLSIAEDMILEFEGEYELPSGDLEILQKNIHDFSYNIRKEAETAIFGDAYCLSPAFLRMLFPFPISSPNLVSKKIEEQRESLGDQTYLCRHEMDNISALFFLNEDKIIGYLNQESHNYLRQTKGLLIVNLSDRKEINIPKLSQWLRKEGRLKIAAPNRVLTDFLVSFFYWIRNERGSSLPLDDLYQKLDESQSVSEKDKARKITHYATRVKEFLTSELPIFSPKYELVDKTGFDDLVKTGFVPQVIGFSFVDSRNDWQSIHNFRSEFEKTQSLLSLSKTKQSGVPTAIENLVVIERKTKTVMLGATLRRINESFSRYLVDLAEIVDLVSLDDFMAIPADEKYAPIFEGIFLYLKDWKDTSKAEEEFRGVMSKWAEFANRIIQLSNKARNFEKTVDKAILFTHSLEVDQNSISHIGDSLEQYQNKISPYSKFLLSTLLEKTLEVGEPKLNEAEKNFADFSARANGKMLQYKNTYLQIQSLERSTFERLGKEKKEMEKEFLTRFVEICRDFTKGAKIDVTNSLDTANLLENVDELIHELQEIIDINENVKTCIRKANAINELLRKWGG